MWVLYVLGGLVLVLLFLAIQDVFQPHHAIRRNFPLVGRLRYMLEKIGPELRQYIVTDNDEERPFSRDQRRWVYSTAKKENKYFGFGSDAKFDLPEYLIVRHAAFPFAPAHNNGSESAAAELHELPIKKVLGEWRDRPGAFQPRSVVNISAMSFGSLSGKAVESINRGSAIAGCLHNTGEGGVSRHHMHGGELIYQIGTGYFGARNSDGGLDFEKAASLVERSPVKAIEVKLSQGAKPGLGGVLPGAKVTAEIAEARGVPEGQTVVSPSSHVEFHTVGEMIDFIERLATSTGVPVGIKSAVGQMAFWRELADGMRESGKGPDFIAIDGGEGGTGAAPLVFSDHVALPFRQGFTEVFTVFAERSMHEKVVWFGSGKLGFPGEALLAMQLGADGICVAREAMMAIGCIQAQRCHTDHCPAGVATHSPWLTRGLVVEDKATRVANYVINLRHELIQLANTCGVAHPADVPSDALGLLLDGNNLVAAREHFGYDPAW